MSCFAVIREGGPRWDRARPLREQEAWNEHADFMDALAEDGFVVLGGPLAGGPTTLLVVNADSEAEIRRRLDGDPWTPMGLLTIRSVEPWEILLGPELMETATRTLR
jgi:uncharacterized protein YciI